MVVKKFLEGVSPLFAGLNVYAQLAPLFELGALGSWMVQYWIPATRWFWQMVFDHLPFRIMLTNADKDSLTAAVFFLPLLAVAAGSSHQAETDQKAPLSQTTTNSLAWGCAAVIVWIVARQPLHDLWQLALGKEAGDRLLHDLLSNIPYYAQVSEYGLYIFLTLALISIIAGFVARVLGRKITPWFGFVVVTLQLLTLFGIVAGALLVSASIGAIRSLSVLIVVLALVVAVGAKPSRIIQIGVAVVVLVVAGFAWDQFSLVRAAMEKD